MTPKERMLTAVCGGRSAGSPSLAVDATRLQPRVHHQRIVGDGLAVNVYQQGQICEIHITIAVNIRDRGGRSKPIRGKNVIVRIVHHAIPVQITLQPAAGVDRPLAVRGILVAFDQVARGRDDSVDVVIHPLQGPEKPLADVLLDAIWSMTNVRVGRVLVDGDLDQFVGEQYGREVGGGLSGGDYRQRVATKLRE